MRETLWNVWRVRVRKQIAVLLCRLGFNGLYWHLKLTKDEWETKLGYRRLREYYEMGCTLHARILKEPSMEKRVDLYQEMYDWCFGFLNRHGLALCLGFSPTFLERNLDVFQGKEVLDYGCGFGQSTAFLSRHAKTVCGLDASAVCIDQARREFGALTNVRFVRHSSPLLDLPSASFDAVYSNDVLEHLHPDDGLIHLREVNRILRPGGRYLLWTPPAEEGPSDGTKWFFPQGYGFKPICGHLKEYTREELVDVARRAGFAGVDRPQPAWATLMLLTKGAT